MPQAKKVFEEYYKELLHIARDPNIPLGISRSVSGYRERRARALERFPNRAEVAKEVRRIKEDCLYHMGELVEKASASLGENGAKVYYAETNLVGREVPPDIEVEVRTIREFLRNKYFKADFGISGCNVLAADTGSVILLESEGNIRLLTSASPVHIILVGIDKVVPNLHDAINVAEVTWRYGGFTMPLYMSTVSGPSATGDIEYTMIRGASGPLELHVIFLDNGRSVLAKDPVLKEALYCLKCGGCLFECPIFQLVAGHYGARGYFGGVGAILAAYMGGGFMEATPVAYTCLRCGRCTEVCPQSIDLSNLITELRHRIAI